MDIDQQAEAARQQTANERAQVAEVFGLTGGELEETAWAPSYPQTIERPRGTLTFPYWYQGVPEYINVSEFRYVDGAGTVYRTVCEDEMFGMVPEIVTDDEGTWKVVARYRTSGECECPMRWADDGGLMPDDGGPMPVTSESPCPLCDQVPGETHGYIYIGDGWAEIVYRLEEIQRATPADAGGWVDGHWGQYAIAHMVAKASDWGYADAEVIDIATRHLASIGPSEAPEITDDEHDALSEASDEVEAWLNEHVAPEGFSFRWWEGEFFLWSEETWGEE